MKSDYTPIVTPDPEEALRLVEEERPHLVLLDLVLPGTDGMELMRDIVEAAEGAGHLPVGLRPGAARGQSPGHGRRRLPGQALLAGGALRPASGRPCAGGRRQSRHNHTSWET